MSDNKTEVAASRKKVSEMTAEERAAYEKRAANARAPKPLYVAHKIVDADGNAIAGAKLEVVKATRNASELLAVVSGNPDVAHTMFEVK